jgi:ubiquinone/menaquinone biosynthesis C-methylase UbiE
MDPTGGYIDYPFVAEFYDATYNALSMQTGKKDVDFYVELAKDCGGPVLEVACGTGRILIPTAQAGIEIVGLDLSTWMLDKCREKLADETDDVRTRVSLVEADMRSFEIGRKFKLITTPFRPFQHLTTVEDQLSCLRTIHRHLEDDGRFVLDLFNPSIPYLADNTRREEFGDEPELTMPDGTTMLRRARVPNVDFSSQIVDCELIYYVTRPDGNKERLVHDFPMRYLFRYEAEHLLKLAGFRVESLYADFDKSPYGSKYPGELIFVSKKA